MNLCDEKQKAFAQRVYFDLKICRKWSKLNVYFDEKHRQIFFLGSPSDLEDATFVLPISSDASMTTEDLFSLKTKLLAALPSAVNENISNVLMAIIANDFTLGYFNLSYGLTRPVSLDKLPTDSESVSMTTTDSIDDRKDELLDPHWATSETFKAWD